MTTRSFFGGKEVSASDTQPRYKALRRDPQEPTEEKVNRLKVLVADDHPLFRDGLAGLMALEEDMEVVGEASDGFEALSKARELKPDVILMDIQMPRLDGLEATRAIKEEMPEVKILMLTIHDEKERHLEAIRHGANGYLLKNIRGQELLDLIRSVGRGKDLP